MRKIGGFLAIFISYVSCTVNLDDNKRILTDVLVTDDAGQPAADVFVEALGYSGSNVDFRDNPFAVLGTAHTGTDGTATISSFIKSEGTTQFKFTSINGNNVDNFYFVNNKVFENSLRFDLGTVVIAAPATVELTFNNVSMVQTDVPWQATFPDFDCIQYINSQGRLDTTRSSCYELVSIASRVTAISTIRTFNLTTLLGAQVVVDYAVNGVNMSETFTVTDPNQTYEINY